MAYLKLKGFDTIIRRGYESISELYSGWITLAKKVFGEDVVCSLDADSVVIVQSGKGNLELLGALQDKIDALANGNEDMMSLAAYIVRERCSYADVVLCRNRIVCGKQGNAEVKTTENVSVQQVSEVVVEPEPVSTQERESVDMDIPMENNDASDAQEAHERMMAMDSLDSLFQKE